MTQLGAKLLKSMQEVIDIMKENTMNMETTPTPVFRELTPEEWAALAAKPEEVLAVTTDEESDHAEELAAETILSAEQTPTLH